MSHPGVDELLLPRTDAGVLIQIVVLVSGFSLAFWMVRRHRELRFFVGGLMVLTASLVALRAVH